MQSLRLVTGVTIEVNDNGDTITAHLEDATFMNNFYDLTTYLRNPQVDIHEGQTKQEAIEAVMDYSRKCMKKIDTLFGEGSSLKIFGNIIPSPFMYASFMDKLIPIFKEYQKKREEDILERYNADRTGGSDV